MENQNRRLLNTDAVVNSEPPLFKDLKTGTVEEVLQKFKQYLGDITLLQGGAPCRVLEPGSSWQQGKVRIAIEFYPDEPQS